MNLVRKERGGLRKCFGSEKARKSDKGHMGTMRKLRLTPRERGVMPKLMGHLGCRKKKMRKKGHCGQTMKTRMTRGRKVTPAVEANNF